MITFVFEKSFGSQARTLNPREVFGPDWNNSTGFGQSTHESGWTIRGTVHEDYYFWVNEFEASHPIFGEVKGDFESEIHATSEKALIHFMDNHALEEWDYGDI